MLPAAVRAPISIDFNGPPSGDAAVRPAPNTDDEGALA